MYHIRLASPPESTPEILEVLGASTGAVNVTVLPGQPGTPTVMWSSAI